jgi:MGT family glycosyltransferase
MPLRGHFNRLLPVISGLCQRGHTVNVFTHREFAIEVQRSGARFVDLFADLPLEEVDNESIPTSSRYVSFAGYYIGRLLDALRGSPPRLIVYDSFATIGWVLARLLGTPYVCVCAGHNRLGSGAVAERLRSGPVSISPYCEEAVDRLHRLGLDDVTPFSYLDCASPYLNIYCEPASFLHADERAPFEPVAFYGSVDPSLAAQRVLDGHPSWTTASSRGFRVYVSFGTTVWQVNPRGADRALEVLAHAIGSLPWAEALISLGRGASISKDNRAMRYPNVRVEDYVDQWRVLQEANVMITHQGLNSTHEALFHCVPMISYPFFGDQPSLTRRCQELGLARPLTDVVRANFGLEEVTSALVAAVEEVNNRELSGQRQVARSWELQVIKNRPQVLEQIASVMA